MKTISVKQFCLYHKIPSDFIDALSRYELIEIIKIDNSIHIQIEEVNKIKRLMRLHYHLNINFEGIDVIDNLTSQIESLQEELITLKNRLEFHK